MLKFKKLTISLVLFLIIIFSFTIVQAADTNKDLDLPIHNVTDMNDYLKSLPHPRQKIPVAIYDLNDRTGQYLEMDDYSSHSTAISQGATDMLINALLNSEQYIIADRSILNQFMTEQDLKRKKQIGFNSQKPFQLNQLRESKYIITGSITEYGIMDTGGTKLKVDGKGFNTEGVIAYAALDLRIVNSFTNEVEYTIALKDGIKGEKKGLDVFSFLGDDYMVDLETGTGWQEPINLVVRRLIEAAVYDMSVNFFADETGIKDDLNSEQVDFINQAFSRKTIVPDSENKSTNGVLILLLGVALGTVF